MTGPWPSILSLSLIIFSACDKDTDGRAHSAELSAAIKDDLAVATPHNPLIVIKHHLYTNFTAYGLEEPTWINVAREPVSRFVSSYYFRRFGFARHEGVRNNRVKAGERAMEMVRISINTCSIRWLQRTTCTKLKYFNSNPFSRLKHQKYWCRIRI